VAKRSQLFPRPQSTWQATAGTIVGPGARPRDTAHGKWVWIYSVRGACNCSLERVLGRKHMVAHAHGSSEGTNGSVLGTDTKFAGTDGVSMARMSVRLVQ
jgi:hypothetical protein